MGSDAASAERALDPELRVQHALELAYRFLGRRDRAIREVRRHLEAKGVEPTASEAAIASLREQGYLDDARFARQLAEDKRLLEGWGAERIERRLAELGVPADLVREAVAARGRDGELAGALELLGRRFPALAEDQRERRRALGVLVRKGYDPELAWDAIRAHARGERD